MPAFTLAGEAFCSVWTSTFHSLCTLPLPEEIGFEQEEIVAGRRLYRWGSMQGGSIAAPDDAAFLSAPCRSSKGGSIILHRQDPGPRQKDDLDDQRSAAMVDSDGGAFPAGWRNEATPCQQPATPEASLLFKAWKTIWLRSPQPRAMHGETKFPCFDDFRSRRGRRHSSSTLNNLHTQRQICGHLLATIAQIDFCPTFETCYGKESKAANT